MLLFILVFVFSLVVVLLDLKERKKTYWNRMILRKSDRSSTSRVSCLQTESLPQVSILFFISYHLPDPLRFLLSQFCHHPAILPFCIYSAYAIVSPFFFFQHEVTGNNSNQLQTNTKINCQDRALSQSKSNQGIVGTRTRTQKFTKNSGNYYFCLLNVSHLLSLSNQYIL